MKKTALIIGFLGLFMILVGLSTPQITSAGWEPFITTWYNCGSGEEISITGMCQLIEKSDWDASGGYHNLYIWMCRGTGIGVTSGSGYRFATREIIPVHIAQGFTGTFMVKGVLIALDKNVPDQRTLFLNHVTYDASGNLRVDTHLGEDNCTEP
jgi:hypothetical protein